MKFAFWHTLLPSLVGHNWTFIVILLYLAWQRNSQYGHLVTHLSVWPLGNPILSMATWWHHISVWTLGGPPLSIAYLMAPHLRMATWWHLPLSMATWWHQISVWPLDGTCLSVSPLDGLPLSMATWWPTSEYGHLVAPPLSMATWWPTSQHNYLMTHLFSFSFDTPLKYGHLMAYHAYLQLLLCLMLEVMTQEAGHSGLICHHYKNYFLK